jgi:4-hydroxybutyrate CoA-transferase
MNVPCSIALDPEVKKHFRLTSAFNLPVERISMSMNVMECTGATYDQISDAVMAYDSDISAIQLCPPDEDGWCNVGAYQVSTHAVTTQLPCMKRKIGFIDPGQYPVPGDRDTHYIHITELDCIVDSPSELVAFPAAGPTDIDVEIASYIMPYIHEGDKIQIGFGGLGEEVLRNLRGVGHVEVFSEVACQSMMDLCKEGVITKITCSSPAACDKDFFDWAHTDPRVKFLPQNITIDPFSIMQQDNMVAINATFMVDLLGQCCSEAQGLTPYSAPGGSFAYIYGAIRSKGGRSFICVRSTHSDKKGNTHSNIVPWLPEGSIVTTSKVFVMYIVTEFGIADVYMKTLKDRIKALIKVAHPDYRKELMEKICTTPLIAEDDFEGYNPFDNLK